MLKGVIFLVKRRRGNEAQRKGGTEERRHRGKEAQRKGGTEERRHRGKEGEPSEPPQKLKSFCIIKRLITKAKNFEPCLATNRN